MASRTWAATLSKASRFDQTARCRSEVQALPMHNFRTRSANRVVNDSPSGDAHTRGWCRRRFVTRPKFVRQQCVNCDAQIGIVKDDEGCVPPSSSARRFTCGAVFAISCRPTSVEPVKLITVPRGGGNKTSPMGPRARRRGSTVLRRLRRSASRAKHRRKRRRRGCLTMTAQPAASAARFFLPIIASGKFHGVINLPRPQAGDESSNDWPGACPAAVQVRAGGFVRQRSGRSRRVFDFPERFLKRFAVFERDNARELLLLLDQPSCMACSQVFAAQVKRRLESFLRRTMARVVSSSAMRGSDASCSPVAGFQPRTSRPAETGHPSASQRSRPKMFKQRRFDHNITHHLPPELVRGRVVQLQQRRQHIRPQVREKLMVA